jgi:hypothetical protein
MDESLKRNKLAKKSLNHEQLFAMDANAAQALFNKLSLEEKVAIVLNTPWEKRQQLILLADTSQALVQGLPDEEIYWTIKETGSADALPVIARTSFEQFQYIIDIDCWQKDRIDMEQVMEWLQLMLRCNEAKVLEWLTNTDELFLNYVFKKLFTISKISEDIDLAEASDSLPQWTLDGRYYFQFANDEARLVSIPFLHLLYKTNSKLFYYMMDNTIWSFETELEDDLFRLRQSRIAEKGFPELDEALQVYQYLSPEHIKTVLSDQEFFGHATAEGKSAPLTLRYSIGTEHPALFLQDILAVIDNSQIIDRIQREIIHLSNQVMIADGREAREIQDLKKSLRKVLGYANIGLELLSKRDTRTAAEIMEAAPMQFLFRAGYSQGLDLKNRLEQLHKIQWQNCRPFRPLFFDGPWGATIEGLSQVRPVYFEGNSKPDSFLFRDFESIAEICVTRQVLDIVGVAEKVLFELLGVDIHNLRDAGAALADSQTISARSVFTTALAQHVVHGVSKFAPVTATELKKFLAAVFIKNQDAEPAFILSTVFCRETIAWLNSQLDTLEDEAAALTTFVESCFSLLQDQCGSIAGIEQIDTRFVTAIIFRK